MGHGNGASLRGGLPSGAGAGLAARREHKSLNQSAKELLASALGLSAPRRTDHSADLERFFGAWDDETANQLRKNLESFSTVNEETWR
ncbi:MAG: hypothetical protein IKH04_10855 [Kiritimatiellae bacterium]|nr:hypothetical protein [Kiritimatiellia bacterium]